MTPVAITILAAAVGYADSPRVVESTSTDLITHEATSTVGDVCGEMGDCCQAHPFPGCMDEDCCLDICALIPSCCTTEWKANCASAATVFCSGCSPRFSVQIMMSEGTGCFPINDPSAPDDNIVNFDASPDPLQANLMGTVATVQETQTYVGNGNVVVSIITSSPFGTDLFPSGFTHPVSGMRLNNACYFIGLQLPLVMPGTNCILAANGFLSRNGQTIQGFTLSPATFFGDEQCPWGGFFGVSFPNAAGQGYDKFQLNMLVQRTEEPHVGACCLGRDECRVGPRHECPPDRYRGDGTLCLNFDGDGMYNDCELGDLNGDRMVDLQDFQLFRVCLGRRIDPKHPDAECDRADLNGDGVVDIRDYQTLANEFDG